MPLFLDIHQFWDLCWIHFSALVNRSGRRVQVETTTTNYSTPSKIHRIHTSETPPPPLPLHNMAASAVGDRDTLNLTRSLHCKPCIIGSLMSLLVLFRPMLIYFAGTQMTVMCVFNLLFLSNTCKVFSFNFITAAYSAGVLNAEPKVTARTPRLCLCMNCIWWRQEEMWRWAGPIDIHVCKIPHQTVFT